jgi:RecA/RadA recombinase
MAKKVAKAKKIEDPVVPKTAVSTPEDESEVGYKPIKRDLQYIGSLSTASAKIDKEAKRELMAATESRSFRQYRLFTKVIDVDLFSPVICGQRVQIVGEPGVGKSLLTMIMLAAVQRTCRVCYTPIITFPNDWDFLRSRPDESAADVRKRQADWAERHARWVRGDRSAFEHATTCSCGANLPMRALFVNTELSFDPIWAAMWGVDVGDYSRYDRQFSDTHDDNTWQGLITREDGGLTICQPSSSAVLVNVLEALIKNSAIDAIVIDSITSIAITEDLDGKERTASHARFWSRMWPLILSWQITSNRDSGARIPIIMTNQFRQTMVSYPGANPNAASSGKAQQYAVDLSLNLVRSKKNTFSEKLLDSVLTRDIEMRLDKYRGTIVGTSNMQVVLKDHMSSAGQMLRAGSTDEAFKVLRYLKEVNNVDIFGVERSGKSVKRYWVLGRPFERLADVATFLERDDVLYRIRFILAAYMFSDVARIHTRELNFNYSPYKDHIGAVIKSLATQTGDTFRKAREHAIVTRADQTPTTEDAKVEKPE